MLLNIWMVVTTSVMCWIKTQEHGVIVMMTHKLFTQGIQIMFMIIYQIKMDKLMGNSYYEWIRWYCVNV